MLPWDRVPVSARNPDTGQRVDVVVGEDLRAAIRAVLDETMSGVKPPSDGLFAERMLLHNAAIDVSFAVAAVLAVVASPDSPFTHGLWVVTGVLAGKTLLQAACERMAR